jgi:cytoskeletal protein RodZ
MNTKKNLPKYMAKNKEMKRKEKKGKIIGWVIFLSIVILLSTWAWISFLTG